MEVGEWTEAHRSNYIRSDRKRHARAVNDELCSAIAPVFALRGADDGTHRGSDRARAARLQGRSRGPRLRPATYAVTESGPRDFDVPKQYRTRDRNKRCHIGESRSVREPSVSGGIHATTRG